ncbi:MAG: FoF1 ATP synthase subunit gamma [Candidatus Woykebacteria bacterium]
MYTKRQIRYEIDSVETIKSLTEIYQQISAISILQVKNSVGRTRNFLAGVSLVYNHAKDSYFKNAQKLIGKKKSLSDLDFIRRNNKEVLVFVSSNQSLYGDLIFKVFNDFIKDVKEKKADSVVVGSLGKALVERQNLDSRVEYFDLADYKPEWNKIQEITDFIKKYEKITVYYGEFLSLVSQIPAKSDISGGATLGSYTKSAKDFFFEPTEKEIMEFFETQVIANLFHQKIYEAQLARFASRLITMNEATKNASEKLASLTDDYLRFKKYLRNKKQLTTTSGRALWGI